MTKVAPTVKKSEHVLLKLFVTGRTPNALRARAAVESLATTHSTTRIDLEVFDVLTNPEIAAHNNVFATPTLIKTGCGPERRLIGDLTSVENLEIGLLIDPAA